jgi:hypothetical protein
MVAPLVRLVERVFVVRRVALVDLDGAVAHQRRFKSLVDERGVTGPWRGLRALSKSCRRRRVDDDAVAVAPVARSAVGLELLGGQLSEDADSHAGGPCGCLSETVCEQQHGPADQPDECQVDEVEAGRWRTMWMRPWGGHQAWGDCMMILATTALRISEVAGLKVGDVDLGMGC